MWQINKLPHNRHRVYFDSVTRGIRILNNWDVMGNRQFFVEGRVVGDFDTDKVKKLMLMKRCLIKIIRISTKSPASSCTQWNYQNWFEQGEVASLFLKTLKFNLWGSNHQRPGPGGPSQPSNSWVGKRKRHIKFHKFLTFNTWKRRRQIFVSYPHPPIPLPGTSRQLP